MILSKHPYEKFKNVSCRSPQRIMNYLTEQISTSVTNQRGISEAASLVRDFTHNNIRSNKFISAELKGALLKDEIGSTKVSKRDRATGGTRNDLSSVFNNQFNSRSVAQIRDLNLSHLKQRHVESPHQFTNIKPKKYSFNSTSTIKRIKDYQSQQFKKHSTINTSTSRSGSL